MGAGEPLPEFASGSAVRRLARTTDLTDESCSESFLCSHDSAEVCISLARCSQHRRSGGSAGPRDRESPACAALDVVAPAGFLALVMTNQPADDNNGLPHTDGNAKAPRTWRVRWRTLGGLMDWKRTGFPLEREGPAAIRAEPLGRGLPRGDRSCRWKDSRSAPRRR
jgi:hypothetical protein